MIMTLTEEELLDYVFNQINIFFPDCNSYNKKVFLPSMIESLKRLEKCFQYVTISGYHLNGEVFFSHLHSDQYTQFLYFFANTAWKNGLDETFSQKLMNLIRYISGMFVSYKCKLPDIFIFYHAVGSVIGNADYSDFLVVFQNVTINTGNSVNGELVPKIGKGCFLAAGAKIIGNKTIGDRVSIGVNALIYNESVLSDTIVICLDGKSVIKKRYKEKCMAQNYFSVEI